MKGWGGGGGGVSFSSNLKRGECFSFQVWWWVSFSSNLNKGECFSSFKFRGEYHSFKPQGRGV